MAAASSSTNTNTVSNTYEERDRISTKPPMFDGENFDYWKDRIEIFFLDMMQIYGTWLLMAILIPLIVKAKRLKENL